MQIKGRIEKANRCRHARLEVQKIFQRAQQDAEHESDHAVKAIAVHDLFPHWKEEGIKHTQEILNVQDGLDLCNQRLNGH